MHRLCYFCKVKYEYTEVKRDSETHFSPICWDCNKKEVHIKKRWIKKITPDVVYDYMKDTYIHKDGREIGRLSYQAGLSF